MYFTYILRELRRRLKQSLVIALGIALVITVSSASAGVKNAQRQVLVSLYGVGTDMTVTRTETRSQVGRSSSAASAARRRPAGRDISRAACCIRSPAPRCCRRATSQR